ncbi:hypothetical protein [Mangrovibacter phragmitis]|uniref:hypothetical protein n=1 Tax=Mangrovibacter phragmitis TaxID=1691903 RepID=UPI0035137296
MNTHNVNTAAQEPSERWGNQNLTTAQVHDLFSHIIRHGRTINNAPAAPGEGRDLTELRITDTLTWLTVSVWLLDGWPCAVSVDGFPSLVVLGNELFPG